MSKLVIDRTTWLRGEGGGNSALLRGSDGKMCCLGFYCVEQNLSAAQLLDVTSPAELAFDWSDPPKYIQELVDVRDDGLVPVDSEVCNHLMNVNDYQLGASYGQFKIATEQERERLITEKFASIGVEVEFIN